MSTGNPMGLSEISHYGTFQRVGGKAGGFINKKWFHPSSIRNQEKLWAAQTLDERLNKKEMELQKRRDEEIQVENMRKQLYLNGQGKATDLFSRAKDEEESANKAEGKQDKDDQKELLDQQKRRMAAVKGQKRKAEAGEDSEESEDEAPQQSAARALAKSKYAEDRFVLGHQTVWGSWFDKDTKLWGFRCCKGMDQEVRCPEAPEEEAEGGGAESSGGLQKSKKRRRKANKGEDAADADADAGAEDEVAPEDPKRGLVQDNKPLMDPKLIEAAERRRSQKNEEDARLKEKLSSKYLANLLEEPSAKKS